MRGWPWLAALVTVSTLTPAFPQNPDHAIPGAISGMREYLGNALGTLRNGDLAALSALPDSSLTWIFPNTAQSLTVMFHHAVTEPIVVMRQGLGLNTLDVPQAPAPRREEIAAMIDSTCNPARRARWTDG